MRIVDKLALDPSPVNNVPFNLSGSPYLSSPSADVNACRDIQRHLSSRLIDALYCNVLSRRLAQVKLTQIYTSRGGD